MAENRKKKQTAQEDDFFEYDDAFTVKEEDISGARRRSDRKRGDDAERGTETRKGGASERGSSRGASDKEARGEARADERGDARKDNSAKKPKKPKKPANPSSVGNQIIIAVMAALAIFIGVCFAAAEKVGVIGGFISEFLPGTFGGAALLIPFLLLIHALYWKRDTASGLRLFRLMFSFAVTILLSTLLHVIFVAAGSVPVDGKMGVLLKDFYLQGISYKGGGAVGGLLGTLGVRGLGIPGALIFSILFLVIAVILFLGYTPGIVWRRAVFYIMRAAEKKKAEKRAKKEQEEKARTEAEAAKAAGTALVVRKGGIGEDILSGNGITDEPKKEEPATYDFFTPEPAPAPVSQEEPAPAPEPIIENIMPVKRTKIKKEEKPKSDVPSVILAGENGEPAIIPEEPPVPEYQFPPIELLAYKEQSGGDSQNEMAANAQKIVSTLGDFNIRTRVIGVSRGPAVTRYEIAPESGTKVAAIMNRTDDISLSLASAVRISGVIPGKSAIGIEVPNKNVSMVYLRSLIDSDEFRNAKSKVTAALGIDITGKNILFDIAKMPHLLIAGATGMGKSVCMNSLIISILYKARPDEVKFIFIDPKKVEFNMYNGIPHLLVPVVFDPKKAAGALHWAVTEMERRYDILEATGKRNLTQYNEAIKDDPTAEKLPQIVIFIDELADLMLTAPDDVETSINRIAAKARAAGMHLIIGTQRPSVDVITGTIKANIPSRIACTVSSMQDSRTILDMGGAEKLIGRGDMLFSPVGSMSPTRVQGAYVDEPEILKIVDFLKNQECFENNETYSREISEKIEKEAARCGQKKGSGAGLAAASSDGDGDDKADPMLDSAIKLAIESGKISTSLIQRKLSLGFGRAAKLIDIMEQKGIVSAPDGQKPRTVLITYDQYLEMGMQNPPSQSDESEAGDEPW